MYLAEGQNLCLPRLRKTIPSIIRRTDNAIRTMTQKRRDNFVREREQLACLPPPLSAVLCFTCLMLARGGRAELLFSRDLTVKSGRFACSSRLRQGMG